MSGLDEYTYKHSKMAEDELEFIASNKKYNYILDTNGTNYSSQQINFDASPLSSLDAFTSLSESFITLPLTMTLTPAGGDFGANAGAVIGNDFAMSLKNGIHNCIHSMIINLNGSNLNSSVPNSNEEMNWRLLKMSLDEKQNFQDIINYSLDTANTIRYYVSGGDIGLGESNNVIKDSADGFIPAGGYGNATAIVNKGRRERMQTTSFNPSLDNAANLVSHFTGVTNAAESWMSYVKTKAVNSLVYHIFAIIPLPILHPVFSKIGLCRGLKLKITLECNTGSTCTIGLAASKFTTAGTSTNCKHDVLPFMISPIGGGLTVSGTTTAVTGTLTIGNDDAKSCRIYLSQYTLNPEYERAYIADPIRTITYDDYTTYSLSNIGPNDAVNHLVTNGLNCIRGFLMVPHLSKTSNTEFGDVPSKSPFSSSPSTSAPYSKIKNFQLRVGSANIFDTAQTYTFETFMEQIRPALSINGGSLNSFGLSSGAISKSMFESGYSFYYVDLSRYTNADSDNTSKAIQLMFNNNSALTMDYHIVVWYSKHFNLDISSGMFK